MEKSYELLTTYSQIAIAVQLLYNQLWPVNKKSQQIVDFLSHVSISEPQMNTAGKVPKIRLHEVLYVQIFTFHSFFVILAKGKSHSRFARITRIIWHSG